jgi:hypothetical protein
MQLTLGARRTAGRRQAADLAPGLPAEQVQPPPTKPHRNGPSALQATVPSGRLQARRIGDLAQPRTGRATIVITLSNQQGGASGICGQVARKAGREQASRSPAVPVGRSRRQCHRPPAGRGIQAPGRTGSARRTCAGRRAWRRTCAAPTCATAQNRPCPVMNWRRAWRRELRPSARRAAPGAGTHLVHAHRHDLGGGGQDQPTLTACISSKVSRETADPARCTPAAGQVRANWHRTESQAFFLLSGPELRSGPGIRRPCRRGKRPGSNACAASGAVAVAVLCCCTRPYTRAHDFELCL